jgi:hypothetical protein
VSSPAASPLRAVLAEIEVGAGSMAVIAQRTGLDPGVVTMVVERLVASGHLSALRLQSGCPDDGCGTCPSGSPGGGGCGASGSGTRGGPVLISLGSVPR